MTETVNEAIFVLNIDKMLKEALYRPIVVSSLRGNFIVMNMDDYKTTTDDKNVQLSIKQ